MYWNLITVSVLVTAFIYVTCGHNQQVAMHLLTASFPFFKLKFFMQHSLGLACLATAVGLSAFMGKQLPIVYTN